jgi:hypothetical protein
MDDARKPIIVTVVIGVVVVLVFALGVGFGGGGDAGGSRGWQDRLAGIGGAGELAAEDVALGAGCQRDGAAIRFSGECAITVAPRGGGLALASPVRRAELTIGDEPIRLRLVLEGQVISQDVDPGDVQRLTFGPKGGTLTLACGTLVGPCVVALA